MSSNVKQQIDTQGYAIVEGLLDEHDLNVIIEDYHELLDRKAWQWYRQGRIASAYEDLDFDDRLTAILAEPATDLFENMDITLPNTTVYPDSEVHVSRAVYDLLCHERLLDRVEEVVGGEILCNPIQHVRIKPAQSKLSPNQVGLVGMTPWHQDQGVARVVADETEMLTVWLAITDATVENGCLQIVPYSHLAGMATHCMYDAVTIPEQLLAGEPMSVPIRAGDALFMHRLMQHSSLANVSDSLRWSFDLRYQPIGYPTGRDEFPSLIVRSHENPDQVQGYEEWRDSWHAARDHLAGLSERQVTHRWDPAAEVCA